MGSLFSSTHKSKTYCGYCSRVKNLLSQIKAKSLNSKRKAALHGWTGQRTVPNMFINGKHIGGSDVVMAKHQQGQLVPLLIETGAIPKQTMQS